MSFSEPDEGLYYYDTNNHIGLALINTVKHIKASYTDSDYHRALAACQLQIKIGRPSTKDFKNIIMGNLLPNCPVTQQDIDAAEDILGPDIGSLKGKTTRRRPHKVKPLCADPMALAIKERYRQVTICADVMHINGTAMLVTVSRNIKLGTIEGIHSTSTENLAAAIKSVIRVYRQGGFKVSVALMDGEFERIREPLADAGIQLNTTSRDEHVGEIEHYIRVVKERVRAIYNTLPFTHMPPRLVLEMAKSAVFWLNSFPHANGVSHTISPREVVTGLRIDYNKHCKYEFGEYVQTHEEHTNGMEPWTIGALALFPTGNRQGGVYFLSLLTGRVLNRTRATRLPMPDDVIDRVHHMARQQRANRGLIFSDRHKNTSIDNYWDDSDDSDDESYHPADNQPEDDDDDYSDDDDDDDGDGDDQAPENHLPVHHTGNVQHKDDDDHPWQPDDDHNNNDDISSVVDSSTVGSDGDQNNEVEEDIGEDGLNDDGPENQGVAAEGLENQGVATEGSENQ